MPQPLVVVDVQKGFLNDSTAHIPARISQLIEQGHHDPVYFVRFINQGAGPFTRLLEWTACGVSPETDFAEEIEPFVVADRVYTKPDLAGLPDELAQELRRTSTDAVTVVGLDTDICVLKVALDLFDLNISPVLLTDCCASTGGLQAHLASLAVLSRAIGAQRRAEQRLLSGAVLSNKQ